MKNRNKKHNPRKAIETSIRAVLKDTCVSFFTGGDELCRLIDINSGRQKDVTVNVYNAIERTRFKWTIYLMAVCQMPNGDRYIKGHEVAATQPYFQTELAEYLNDEHQKLISSNAVNEQHLVAAAWVATPYEHEWDEAQAFKLMESQGAWG